MNYNDKTKEYWESLEKKIARNIELDLGLQENRIKVSIEDSGVEGKVMIMMDGNPPLSPEEVKMAYEWLCLANAIFNGSPILKPIHA